MSVEILSTGDAAVMIDKVTGFAFGPVFRLEGIAFDRFNEPFEYAESFVDWCLLRQWYDLESSSRGSSARRLAMELEAFNDYLSSHEPCDWCPRMVPRGDEFCDEHQREKERADD